MCHSWSTWIDLEPRCCPATSNPHFLVPVTTQWSPFLIAVVWRPETSEPANASLIAKAANFFPLKISGNTAACNSGEPWFKMGGTAITPPFNKPSTTPRVPNRASSVLTINLGENGQHEPSDNQGTMHFVEIIKLFWLYYATHDRSPPKMFPRPKAHG